MMDSRLFEAVLANEPMAFPTTEAPMDFSRRVEFLRTPTFEKISRPS